MKFRSILAMLLVVAITPGALSQSNGSFELGTDPGSFDDLFTGQTNITDWDVTGSVDYIGTLWVASDGVRSVDLTGDFAGSLSQSVATTPGFVYSVTFDLSGNPDGPNDTKTMGVTTDGGSAQTYTYAVTAANTRTNMMWRTETYYFSALDAEALLAFTSLTPGFFGPALDNVRVNVVNQVCHQNDGNKGPKTLTVGAPAVAPHLAHGDTPGPCAAS
ncbi:MAG TPA: choice-of-anchor C family protein [Pyrinomonadaceae bacterium]|nr:choice-of-anchor C family protein [Pyrinomonadaceae bacterium]